MSIRKIHRTREKEGGENGEEQEDKGKRRGISSSPLCVHARVGERRKRGEESMHFFHCARLGGETVRARKRGMRDGVLGYFNPVLGFFGQSKSGF